MKKILFTLNHIEPQNGVCSVLKTLSGALAKLGFDVTVMPLFRYDDKYAATFDSRVKIKKCYGKYFRGLGKIVRILPQKSVYKIRARKLRYRSGSPVRMPHVHACGFYR